MKIKNNKKKNQNKDKISYYLIEGKMGIRISKIIAKDLGPIKNEINWEFKDFNLIYGKNEKGKSLIVEFIIQTLFKKSGSKNKENNDIDWGHLRKSGSGKILVKGFKSIDESTQSDEIEFYSELKKEKSLSHYLLNNSLNFPFNILKLLIVKEGEVSIEKEYEEGISLKFIKDIFSMDKLLNEIEEDENKIPKNIRSYVYEKDTKVDEEGKNNFQIKKSGSAKELEESYSEIKRLNDILKSYLESTEKSEEVTLKLELLKLNNEKELLLKAKRYKVFKLSQKLDNLKIKEKSLNWSEIGRLEELINDYENKKEQLNKIDKEINLYDNKLYDEQELLKIKEQQIKAKRFKAYSISNELDEVKKLLEKYSEDEVNNLINKIEIYKTKKGSFIQIKNQVENLEKEAKNLDFLNSLKDFYERYINDRKLIFSNKFLGSYSSIIIFSLLLFLSTFFSVMSSTIISNINLSRIIQIICLITTIIGGALLIYTIFYFLNVTKETRRNEEIKNIRSRFESIFGKKLQDISQLNELILSTQRSVDKLNILKEQFQILSNEISITQAQILESFKNFEYLNLEEKEWDKIVDEIKRKRRELKEKYEKLKINFEKLEIDNSFFEKIDPKVQYDFNIYTEVEEKLKEMNRIKEEKQNKIIEKENLKKDLENITSRINHLFKNVLNNNVEIENWLEKLDNLKVEAKEVEKEISKIEGELSGFSVTPDEYISEEEIHKLDIDFSQQKLDEVLKDIEKLKNKVDEVEKRELGLKAKLASITELDISTNLSDLITKTYQLKEVLSFSKKELESKILATILVLESIMELKKQEDEKLKTFLQSKQIKDSLKKMTTRYNEILYEKDSDNQKGNTEFYLVDDYNKFNLKDLSTGAKEQVMLALRVGFLKYLFRDKSGFIILDDAFQHSDYERRQALVDSLVELAKDKWQIFYFTMDDNIKKLIEEKTQNNNYEFCQICL